jgi:hypothetical protein
MDDHHARNELEGARVPRRRPAYLFPRISQSLAADARGRAVNQSVSREVRCRRRKPRPVPPARKNCSLWTHVVLERNNSALLRVKNVPFHSAVPPPRPRYGRLGISASVSASCWRSSARSGSAQPAPRYFRTSSRTSLSDRTLHNHRFAWSLPRVRTATTISYRCPGTLHRSALGS